MTQLVEHSPPSLDSLQAMAGRIRGAVVQMSHRAKTPHLGSALSCVDILVAAYWGGLVIDPAHPDAPQRDRFILSNGHAVSALYATLAYRGFFAPTRLDSFAQPGSHLPEQPSPACVPGLEWATGSLGHGLSIGLGMALAGRIQRQTYRVMVLMSDGECNEGSVWEAAMLAPTHRLDRLLAVIDYNKWQATARTDEIMGVASLRAKWEAFGWSVYEVDGHDVEKIGRVLRQFPDGSGKPIAVVAHTVKGKGVSFMEDDNNWHYRVPDAQQVLAAHKELGLA